MSAIDAVVIDLRDRATHPKRMQHQVTYLQNDVNCRQPQYYGLTKDGCDYYSFKIIGNAHFIDTHSFSVTNTGDNQIFSPEQQIVNAFIEQQIFKKKIMMEDDLARMVSQPDLIAARLDRNFENSKLHGIMFGKDAEANIEQAIDDINPEDLYELVYPSDLLQTIRV